VHITSLGHAGFLVETPEAIVVMDPWLSPEGAFDASWFQFPANHHLPARARFVYVSHEHKDHFDPAFLRSLRTRDFTFVVPRFRRPELRERLAELGAPIVVAEHGARVELPGGYARLFLDDSELNRDSGVFVRLGGHSFLNINDCKLHDHLHDFVDEEGPPDAFAAQFSGATWHPTCYDYAPEDYARISKKKARSKFEAVAQAITTLRPRAYLASAGPPVFLDPLLLEKNFEAVNIFPHAPEFLGWLGKRLRKSHPALAAPPMMPGDVLDVAAARVVFEAEPRVTEATYEAYVRAYAARYAGLFAARRAQHDRERARPGYFDGVLARLRDALQEKLDAFTLAERLERPLYVRFLDAPEHALRVDFARRAVAPAGDVREAEFYALAAPSWELVRVLDGALTWEDFALTFRMRLNRAPDVYQTLMQGFLIMEPEDLEPFCRHVLDLEQNRERIVVEAGGCRFAVDRFCPHQGADLAEGWVENGRYLVCARHRWRFDLERDGVCDTAEGSIHALPLEES
jgi:UDP-MurNAc hydroxylase